MTDLTKNLSPEIAQNRKPTYPISSFILNRWSPRAMSGEEITQDELMSLFEAARWAPSSYNNQPWRFIYARRNTPAWEKLFNLMVEFNQSWTKNAAVLVLIVSAKNFDHNGEPNNTHSFDAGSAWENLALEAEMRNLVTHGMAGFDYDKARTELNIPEDFQVEALIAIGKKGKVQDLPEMLQDKEKPSDRKPLSEIVMEGEFRK